MNPGGSQGSLRESFCCCFMAYSDSAIKAIKRQNLALEVKVRERTEHLEKTLGVLIESEKTA